MELPNNYSLFPADGDWITRFNSPQKRVHWTAYGLPGRSEDTMTEAGLEPAQSSPHLMAGY